MCSFEHKGTSVFCFNPPTAVLSQFLHEFSFRFVNSPTYLSIVQRKALGRFQLGAVLLS